MTLISLSAVCSRISAITSRTRPAGWRAPWDSWTGSFSRETSGRGICRGNLATCRVFVPLYSRRYFQSEHCGKEWAAFRDRARNGSAQASGHVEAILPALWRPVPHQALPEAASEIHFNPGEIGQIYAEYGFYGIMKLTRFSEEYEWVVYDLAERILRVAERAPDPGPAMGYGCAGERVQIRTGHARR